MEVDVVVEEVAMILLVQTVIDGVVVSVIVCIFCYIGIVSAFIVCVISSVTLCLMRDA